MPHASHADPFLRTTWTDPETGTRGFVVIDRLVRRIAGGGLRMRAGCTLAEVERLARTMSYKNGILGVAAGGAKGGLDCDPHDPRARDVLVRFVRDLRPFLESYWATAEDMGVTQELLDGVFEEVGLGLSVYAALKHTGDFEDALRRIRAGFAARAEEFPVAAVAGGYGVAVAALAAIERLGLAPSDVRAVIQGFGSMGGATARYLARGGVRVVGIVDANGGIANPARLDVERLLAARNGFGEIDRAALRPGDRRLPREDWLAIDAELIVPAAVADAITVENARAVAARLVVEAANIPTTAEAERRLHARGVVIVPDFVANAGTNAWYWWTILGLLPPSADAAFDRLGSAMREAVTACLDVSAREGITPREAAAGVALANLDRLSGG